MSIIDSQLLPRTATVNDAGVLSIGGVTVAAMAEQFGTPLYVYDEEHLRNRCREAVAAFGKDRVIYATKAFLCGAMARLANEEGLLLDVATGGELFAALHAGVPGERCVLHGNNKSVEELRAAITARVQHIVVDSFDELDRIEKLHSEGMPAPRVQLRITPGVHVDTHDYVATGQDDSKFGFNLNNGDAMRAIQRAQASAAVELVGIHCHIGSNVLSVANFADACAVMVNLFLSVDLPELTLGGGLGVAYTNGETAPSMSEWADVLKRATSAIPSEKKVFVEPGRSIVATAGLTVYEVGTVKSIEGIRTYVSVDGGMSDNPRPMMYGSAYEAFDPARTSADRTEHVRIVGKHCESGDIVIRQIALPSDIVPGDILAIPATGAYGRSMASNYNHILRPPVVVVRDGSARTIIRREKISDLLALEEG